jgi:hypothetical protein
MSSSAAAELHRCAVRRQRHDSGRHLVRRYLGVDVTLRNCQRLLGIDVQPVNVQRAENTCDIVSALSAEAGFKWAEFAQCRYSFRVECFKPIVRVAASGDKIGSSGLSASRWHCQARQHRAMRR